jgi:quinone-modifying oxidoreductase subunit QmoC
MNGFGEGVKVAMKNQKLGMAMMKAGRMSPMEMAGGHGVKDPSGLQKMLKKAQELEDARISGEAS